MTTISKSAKLFQERRLPESRHTWRRPGPRSDLERNLVHRIPLEMPLPTIPAIRHDDATTPDAGLTEPWAYGSEEIV